MSPTKEFVRAWHVWRHTRVPTSNSRLGRAASPTYGPELDLDHLHSRLYSLGSAVIEGKKWDYGRFAAEELAGLNKVSVEIEGSDVPEGAREEFRGYVSAARLLLESMQDPFSTGGAV